MEFREREGIQFGNNNNSYDYGPWFMVELGRKQASKKTTTSLIETIENTNLDEDGRVESVLRVVERRPNLLVELS